MSSATIQVTNVFERLESYSKRIVLLRGGTRSSKTYSVCQHLALWLLQGEFLGQPIPTGYASVVRKTFPALKATAMRDFEEIVQNMGVGHLLKVSRTDHKFSFNGRTVEFFSLDDPLKVHGRKREILYVNECNEINFSDFGQLMLRTKDRVVIDLNPSDPYTWAKSEIEDKRAIINGDVDIDVSTYLDNATLPQSLIDEVESLRELSPSLWNVYGLGQWGEIKGAIFAHAQICQAMPEAYKKRWYGLDFGFTNDPTAIVEVREGYDGAWYLDELGYEPTPDTRQLHGLLEAVIKSKQTPIFSDSLPLAVNDLRANGWMVVPCKKGKDSVLDGINLLLKRKIFITSRSINAIKEKNSYIWREVNGQATNVPIDKFNHFWDAVRYVALETAATQKRVLYL